MSKQKCYIGRNALEGFKHELNTVHPSCVFLVRGKGSYEECGAQSCLQEIFKNEDVCVVEWSDFMENPRLEEVYLGVRLLRESRATAIVACGGGSVLDMAKLVRLACAYDGNDLTGKLPDDISNLLPLFALPTTSGTGCESTPFAVCYKNGKKYSVAHPNILPDYAFIYPPFTYTTPPYLTACSGFDALAQAIEAYWNVNATPESDHYSEEAIALLWNNLYKAVNMPTDEVRDAMSLGAHLAGEAIAMTKTTAPHAFSYAFTTQLKFPHGHAVALTFPYFAELNMELFKYRSLHPKIQVDTYAVKMEHLQSMLGLPAEGLKNQMYSFIESLGLNLNLPAHTDVQWLLSQVNLQRLGNNPVIVEEQEMKELFNFLVERE